MTPLYVQLKALRKAKRWTLDDLAEHSGVSRSTIIRLEHRQTAGIDFTTLEQLATALNVAPGSLIQQVPADELKPKRGRK
jgi:transcriptional regulator with XRE-family HTH domain